MILEFSDIISVIYKNLLGIASLWLSGQHCVGQNSWPMKFQNKIDLIASTKNLNSSIVFTFKDYFASIIKTSDFDQSTANTRFQKCYLSDALVYPVIILGFHDETFNRDPPHFLDRPFSTGSKLHKMNIYLCI